MTWYFGSDSETTSNTQACATSGGSFYIGRLGVGTSPTTSSERIWTLPSGSSRAGFPYWNVRGPNSSYRPSGITPEAWGTAQARVYFSGWNKVWSSGGALVGKGRRGKTLFGSISLGSGGWSTTNVTANRAVVNGFISDLVDELNGTGTVGIYGSKCDVLHCSLGASSWAPTEHIVVWMAEWIRSSCGTAESDYCKGGMPNVGGYTPMIWQYYGGTNYPDYDISPYEGGSLDLKWTPTPVTKSLCSSSYSLAVCGSCSES